MNAILAGVYFFTAGLLVYFRLGPVRDVLVRLERDGARVDPWVPLLFTLGTFGAAGYLAWRGARALRRSLRAGRPGEPPPEL